VRKGQRKKTAKGHVNTNVMEVRYGTRGFPVGRGTPHFTVKLRRSGVMPIWETKARTEHFGAADQGVARTSSTLWGWDNMERTVKIRLAGR